MELSEFRDYTNRLRDNLANDPDVLGFVAVGSMSEIGRLPDQWSDHDFFVVVADGKQDRYRHHFDWLPDNQNIVFSFQETAHGVKVVYDDSHMLEFAVFNPDELFLAKINSFNLLIDRSDIRERLDKISEETARWSQGSVAGTDYLTGQFLTNLMVGAARHFRGEKMSGYEFAKVHGLNHFVKLVAKHITPDNPEELDNISPLRRFEQAYISIGERINHCLTLETPEYVKGMLELFEDCFRHKIDGFPQAMVNTVRKSLEIK